jgi:hypothetical protein
MSVALHGRRFSQQLRQWRVAYSTARGGFASRIQKAPRASNDAGAKATDPSAAIDKAGTAQAAVTGTNAAATTGAPTAPKPMPLDASAQLVGSMQPPNLEPLWKKYKPKKAANPEKTWLEQLAVWCVHEITVCHSVLPLQPSAKSLSSVLRVSTVDILKTMIKMGERPTRADDPLPRELAELLALDRGFTVTQPKDTEVDIHPRPRLRDAEVRCASVVLPLHSHHCAASMSCCRSDRRSCASWATSITARRRCSTACATRRSLLARRAASHSRLVHSQLN